MVGYILLVTIKDAVTRLQASAVIFRKLVLSVGNDVLKANDQNRLFEFGGDITLTDDSPRGVLKSIDWLQKKKTTENLEPCPQFLAKKSLLFKRQCQQLSIVMKFLII